MKLLTLDPDPDMRWIYDYTHPDYNSDQAKHLREARSYAIRTAPKWMLWDAAANTLMKRSGMNKEPS